MTRVGVESCCWWGDIKLLNQLTHLLKLQPLNNLSEATQCTEKCKTQFFWAYRKETQAMFSKFMGTEKRFHQAQQDPVSESSSVSILRSVSLLQNAECLNFPCLPCPGAGQPVLSGWRAETWRKMQQQSKQEACRGWYWVGGELHNILANPSFQAAGSTTDSPATACPDSQKVPELPEQRSDANKNSLQAPR